MFRIRVFTPAVLRPDGRPHAGAEIVVGAGRRHFLLDLSCWSIPSYQRQWREGVARLARGASTSALLAAYRGPGDEPHVIWALWREVRRVYVQSQTVIPGEDAPFDPARPYAHVGERIAATSLGLPIQEWRCDVSDLLSPDFGVRWPG